jgi:general secretion pathway protein E
MHLAAELGIPLSVRLKTLARLDIAERFRPQDGRFGMRIGGGPVDFRIAVLPTKFGESIVLRILDRRRLFRRLDDLPMAAPIAEKIRGIVGASSGLLLVTGPTGSGKTTTLYAALQELGDSGGKILSIEDPVEYEIENCLQTPVDLALGRTFSSVLRAFLRHDPDKIFVGEIRDGETAQIALRAALTGHLVVSTLHTATARDALVRMEEMGVDRVLLSTCLRGILSQRLLRLNCPHCAAPDIPSAIPPPLATVAKKKFRRSPGCRCCAMSGHGGRRAIFEFLAFPEKRNASDKISGETLVARGVECVEAGEISVEEFSQQLPWNR